jgi:hypothetical protein
MQIRHLGVALALFFGYLCGAASAQEIPKEARDAIAKNQEGSFMVYRDAVQEDLKLSDEQKDTLDAHLRELLPEAMQFFNSLDGVSGEEREKKLQDFRKTSQEKLERVLKDALKEAQTKRLRQLSLQQAGAFALVHTPEIGKELKITDEQRQQFVEVVQDLQQKISPLIKEAQSGGDPDEIRPKVMKIRKEHEDKIEALLTDAQKQQWKEMLGKRLTLDE